MVVDKFIIKWSFVFCRRLDDMEGQLPQVNKARNTSIELLRIIAMLMIIFHHFAVHGGFSFADAEVSIPHFWYYFIQMGGKIGVNIFILISGYFLIEKKDAQVFNFKRILKFWGQVFFYSVFLTIIVRITSIGEVGVKDLIKMLFPITFETWGFASTYFVLYLIYPFLNRLLHSINKGTYQKLLVLLVVIWSIIPTFTTSSYQGSDLLWFITLYCIAGYIKRFGFNCKFQTKHYFGMWLVFSLFTYLTAVVFTLLGTKWPIVSSYALYFFGQNKITVLLASLSLFMTFATLNIKYNNVINIIASTTFSIYLIHDNKYIRFFLWRTVFRNASYANTLALIPYSILAVGIVFVVCSTFDFLRIKLIEKPYMKFVNKYADSVLKPFSYICEKTKMIIFGR